MRFFNAVISLAAAGLALAGCAAERSFQLVDGGRPAAVFLVEPERAELLSGIIDDFNDDLYECAGCRLPAAEADPGEGFLVRFAVEDRGLKDEDRFDITFPDERTMLVTGSTHSIRWALNHILEEHAGVRYLLLSREDESAGIRNTDGQHFPRLRDLSVPAEPVGASPHWNISRRAGHNPYWNSRTGNFAYRVPCGHHLWLHAFPVQRYIREGEFPEYIFPVVDGERYLPYEDPARERAWRQYTGRWSDYGAGWHQCLTDPRVVDEAVRNLVEYFDRNPGVRGVSIALNDHGANYCECEGCAPLVGEGRNMGGYRDYSDIYFRWANMVAEGVAEKHPDRFFGTLAYRETLNPPGFDLRENIIPYITYDIQSCQDPDVKAGWLALLEGWSERANYLGRYEYAWGGTVYQMPRVYFELQQEMMRADYEYGARAVWFSGVGGGIEDGPKKYLYNKLMWDVNLDLEDTLNDWYRACVGREAAPYLAEYFRLWEEIWREEAVKTSWFRSSKNKVYLSMGNQSYLYAVRPGDLENLRGLMERVVKLAAEHGDARQGRRAGWLMADFEYSEACVYSIGGHIFPPAGVAETAEQALSYLEFLPGAWRYFSRLDELHERRMISLLHPGLRRRAQPYVYMALAQAAGMASEPGVLAALEEVSEDGEVPAELRNLVRVFVAMERGDPVDNLMLDGAFTEENRDFTPHELCPYAVPLELSGEKAYSGDNSLKLRLGPPYRYIVSTRGRDVPFQEVSPGMYYASMMVYIDSEHHDVESYVTFRLTERNLDGAGSSHFDSAHVNVPPGEWTRISHAVEVGEEMNSINIASVTLRNYGAEDTAFIDDVVLVYIGG